MKGTNVDDPTVRACRYRPDTKLRVIPGRHRHDPCDDTCTGCQPCEQPHCGICCRTHADVTCAECLAATRETLHNIADMCEALPEEAEHHGVHGEAMMLNGPTSDPEAWRNRAMSAMQGRIEASYLEDCRDEKHPLWVLGSWEQLWRDHLDQPTDLNATLPRVVDYLNRRMHDMAGDMEIPFEDFAADLRGCLGHLRAVLHDQNQGDRANVGCFDCGAELERKLTAKGFEDVWTCQRCRRRYTYAEYNFALRAHLEEARKESA